MDTSHLKDPQLQGVPGDFLHPQLQAALMDTQQHPRDHPSTQSFRGHQGPPQHPREPLTPLSSKGYQGLPAPRGTQNPPVSPVPRVIWEPPAILSSKGNPETPQHPSNT